jgi:LSD1 subclass zinc finger protein
MTAVQTPELVCLACQTPLPRVSGVANVRCTRCRTSYPVHFGIADLRGSRLRVAGAAFDADADLVEAERIALELSRTTYREWFFSAVDRRVDRIDEPRFRELMRKYYLDERQMFGRHGQAILDKLEAFLEAREPERHDRWRRVARIALEAGCGTGQYALGFASRFAQVLVTDISYVSLVQAQKIASEHGLLNVSVFASDLEHIPLADGTVDFVHCNGVIEHVSDPGRVVSECARVMSTNGVTLILSPNLYSLYTEAHFRVPGFGFWPMPLRRALAYRASGVRSFAGTTLRSLNELKRLARRSFAHHRVYFLPPHLPPPVRPGPVRRTVHALLSAPLSRGATDLLLNRVLLPVAPYHVVVGFKR